ncbi:MAG TPA: hypothetical protein PLU37_09750 [Chitinophagaceae bacterium]|nr:hypothetical protein [Chitinophagaceae bacterium]MCB9055135.1 hypothetical protein [Chitinophagales bacterium]HPG11803.1 hypothetical protein [Chitinophagaceae bacterium]HRX94198.1 hypothetical protein [Chitinophagaceae bacterium]
MQRKKLDVDVVNDVLLKAMAVYPENAFVKSLHYQYHERGGLSKKQLEGLFQKAKKIKDLPPQKLATLEALILKKPTKYKSDKPAPTPLYAKDENTGKMIKTILEKYPQHKRIQFFKTKYDNNEVLSTTELSELQRFAKLLL